jgi:hypothetical protein
MNAHVCVSDISLQEQGSLGAGMKHKFFNKRVFGGLFVGTSTKQAQAALSARLKAVSKLMDSYLAEVARDSKLPLDKFHSLAEAVPVSARVSDDGLYRAIDTYLKVRNLSEPRLACRTTLQLTDTDVVIFLGVQIHTNLAEHEKKKLCRNLDCSRFSVAACMHAAQNERLPLRIVVQVRIETCMTGCTSFCLEVNLEL